MTGYNADKLGRPDRGLRSLRRRNWVLHFHGGRRTYSIAPVARRLEAVFLLFYDAKMQATPYIYRKHYLLRIAC